MAKRGRKRAEVSGSAGVPHATFLSDEELYMIVVALNEVKFHDNLENQRHLQKRLTGALRRRNRSAYDNGVAKHDIEPFVEDLPATPIEWGLT